MFVLDHEELKLQQWLVSVTWVVSFFAAMICIIILPKQHSRCNTVGWLAISFYLLISINGLFAGLLTILRVPFGLVPSIFLHLGIVCLTFAMVRHAGRIQRQDANVFDLVVVIVVAAIVALCARAEFGPNLTLHYLTSDPAVHLGRVKSIVDTGAVDGMYLAWSFIAELIWAASPLFEGVLIYKALIVADVLNLFFGGMLLYSVTTTIFGDASNGKKILFGLLTIAYLLGYPLNGMLYGFCYLAVGVSFGLCSLLFSIRFRDDQGWFNIAGLFLSLFGVITSYALFAPIVFLVAFVNVLIVLKSVGRNILALHSILLVLCVFAIPGLLGLMFSYVGTFGIGESQTTSAATTIAWEGGIYRSFYSNFMLLVPFSALGVFSLLKSQRTISGEHNEVTSGRPLALFVIGIAMYLFIFLALLFAEKVSSYYFFKLYYLLSPFMFCSAAVGAMTIARHPTPFLVATGLSVVFLGVMSVFKVDERLAGRFEPYEVVSSGYHPCLDIYEWNLDSLQTAKESPSADVLQLFDKARSLYQNDDKPIPILGNYVYSYWYTALVRGAITNDYVVWINETDTIVQRILENCDYVLVITKEEYATVGTAESSKILESLEGSLTVEFRNDSGFIARVE